MSPGFRETRGNRESPLLFDRESGFPARVHTRELERDAGIGGFRQTATVTVTSIEFVTRRYTVGERVEAPGSSGDSLSLGTALRGANEGLAVLAGPPVSARVQPRVCVTSGRKQRSIAPATRA